MPAQFISPTVSHSKAYIFENFISQKYIIIYNILHLIHIKGTRVTKHAPGSDFIKFTENACKASKILIGKASGLESFQGNEKIS